MKKLAEYSPEQGIEIIADLIIPMVTICQDKELIQSAKRLPKAEFIRSLLKTHSKEVVDMLAIIDQEDRETYNPGFFALPSRLIEFFNMPEVNELFFGQSQKIEPESSGLVTGNTEEFEK